MNKNMGICYILVSAVVTPRGVCACLLAMLLGETNTAQQTCRIVVPRTRFNLKANDMEAYLGLKKTKIQNYPKK